MKNTRIWLAILAILGIFTGVLQGQDIVGLPDSQAGVKYEYQFQSDGGLPPLKWKIAGGELPPGIELEDNGRLKGTPAGARPGAYQFTINVSDSSQPPQTYSLKVSMVVKPAPLRILVDTQSGANPNLSPVTFQPEHDPGNISSTLKANPVSVQQQGGGAQAPKDSSSKSKTSTSISPSSITLCSGEKVKFTAKGFKDPSQITWNLSGDDGQTGSFKGKGESVIYQAPTTEDNDPNVFVGTAILTAATSGSDKASADIVLTGKCGPDDRGIFQATAYMGAAIDSFAGDETLKYLNFNDSGDLHARAVGGFDFAYRLLGDENRTPEDRPHDLWVYGETIHGVRSADVACQGAQATLLICSNSLAVSGANAQNLFFLLRNASSLEGYAGLRYEFLGLQQNSDSPANLYFKAQAGFLDVTGQPRGILALHHLGLGAIATKGKYENSYLEVGIGRSDTFQKNFPDHPRYKVDAYLERRISGKLLKPLAASFFTQITVDTDLGHGSSAVQSYLGFNFDLKKIFNPTDTGTTTTPGTAAPKAGGAAPNAGSQ